MVTTSCTPNNSKPSINGRKRKVSNTHSYLCWSFTFVLLTRKCLGVLTCLLTRKCPLICTTPSLTTLCSRLSLIAQRNAQTCTLTRYCFITYCFSPFTWSFTFVLLTRKCLGVLTCLLTRKCPLICTTPSLTTLCSRLSLIAQRNA